MTFRGSLEKMGMLMWFKSSLEFTGGALWELFNPFTAGAPLESVS